MADQQQQELMAAMLQQINASMSEMTTSIMGKLDAMASRVENLEGGLRALEGDGGDDGGNGLLLWVTGVSGAGKTTLGEGLRTEHGFLHFDGDTWAKGGDPLSYSGITTEEMVKSNTEEQKALWNKLYACFERLWEGEDVPVEDWAVFHKPLCEAVAKAHGNARGKPMVVTFSVYQLSLRKYIEEQLPAVQFVVLNDQGTSVDRKFSQVLDTAKERGQELFDMLNALDGDRWDESKKEDCQHLLRKQLERIQLGFEPGEGALVTKGKDKDQVLREVVQKYVDKKN